MNTKSIPVRDGNDKTLLDREIVTTLLSLEGIAIVERVLGIAPVKTTEEEAK